MMIYIVLIIATIGVTAHSIYYFDSLFERIVNLRIEALRIKINKAKKKSLKRRYETEKTLLTKYYNEI